MGAKSLHGKGQCLGVVRPIEKHCSLCCSVRSEGIIQSSITARRAMRPFVRIPSTFIVIITVLTFFSPWLWCSVSGCYVLACDHPWWQRIGRHCEDGPCHGHHQHPVTTIVCLAYVLYSPLLSDVCTWWARKVSIYFPADCMKICHWSVHWRI